LIIYPSVDGEGDKTKDQKLVIDEAISVKLRVSPAMPLIAVGESDGKKRKGRKKV
jgi:hypothetical protein